jgi:transcriptional regulator with XRE-family HTH domain
VGTEEHDLPARIRAARERAGVTQEELARRLGMSTKGYRAYESHRHPTPERIQAIADALEITTAELLVDDGLSGIRRELVRIRNDQRLARHEIDELKRELGDRAVLLEMMAKALELPPIQRPSRKLSPAPDNNDKETQST